MHIERVEGDLTAEGKAVRAGLREFNNRHAGERRTKSFTLVVKDGTGRVTAGLNAQLYWNWLYVEHLWVSDELRGQGVGSELLRQAEDAARADGRAHVYLDTFHFQAPEFYKKHGYTRYGILEDFPPGGRRHFFRKDL